MRFLYKFSIDFPIPATEDKPTCKLTIISIRIGLVYWSVELEIQGKLKQKLQVKLLLCFGCERCQNLSS